MTANTHLALLFALGPVQDFIATARKGQDLWFGSWLLSELSREAAKAAQSQGAELILPAPASLDGGDAVANKVVVRVAGGQAPDVAKAMESAVRGRLAHLGTSVFDKIAKTPDGHHLHRKAAEAQVSDLPEIYWVAVDEIPGNWGETRRRAEAALAARKALRDFGPVTWGAPVPKSRLDGQRESVVDERAFERVGNAGRQESLRRSFGIGPAERLCGVGLLKRNGRRALDNDEARGAQVVSTAHVASFSLRRAWRDAPALQAPLREAFRAYVDGLPDQGAGLSEVPRDHADPVLGRIDGQVLFASRLGDLYETSDLRAAEAALANFLRKTRELLESEGLPRPMLSPYYAVLRADGDRMGAWLDGLSTPDDHRRASEALGGFASAAERTVATHHGHCVFAGGDDVLALLPVATALDCAEALDREFRAAVATGPGGERPTLSVGLQIAHATDPFRQALNGAGEAERAAKQTYGRAAFAVRLDKRSGVPILVGGKWSEFASFRALQGLQEPGSALLPRGLGYDLRRIADRLNAEDPDLGPIRKLEVNRVLDQKQVGKVAAQAVWKRLGDHALANRRLMHLCDELVVARALAAQDGEDS